MPATQKNEVSKVVTDDVSKASMLNPKTIVGEEKSVSTSSTSSVDEKRDAKIIDMRPMESQIDTSKSTSATTENSKAHTSNSATESKQKDLTAVLSSSDIQEIKAKVFGKTDDVSKDTSTTVPGKPEDPESEASYSKSSNDVAWKQDSFSDGPKSSGDKALPVTENTETELNAIDEASTEMAQARTSTTVNRSPARGFGKPVSAKSKRSKPSKN